MKKLFYIIIISILISCNDEQKLDGIWFSAYTLTDNNEIIPLSQKTLLEFKNDTVYTIRIGDLATGDLNSIIIDTSIYALNNSVLQIGNHKMNIIYKTDSIVIKHKDSKEKSILRRLNSSWKDQQFKEKDFIGSYIISSKNYNDSIDFINDSILIFTGDYNMNFPFNIWRIINYGGFNFMNIQNQFFPLLVLKSSTDKKMIFEYPILKNVEFTFTQTEKISQQYNLIGNWNEIKISVPKPLPPLMEINEEDVYYKLIFDKDSLLVKHMGREKKMKWSLSSDGKMIYFIDKIFTDSGSWKVLELSEDILTIKISLNSGFNEEIVYLKKQN